MNGNGYSSYPSGDGPPGYGNGHGGASGNGHPQGASGYGPVPGSGDRSVPGARKVATGRHSSRRGPADDDGTPANGHGPPSDGYSPPADGYRTPAPDDTGSWYRPRSNARSDATGSAPTTRRSAARGSARPGYYNPDDDVTGFGAGTGRYGGAGPYGPGEEEPGRRGSRRGAERDSRGRPDPGDDPGSPVRKILRRLWYGRWWRHWSAKKVALLFGALCAMMALVLVASFFVVLNSTKVPIKALSQPLQQSSVVYFSNGKEVGCFCTANRNSISPEQVHKSMVLVNAVLAAEDRGFFTEGGISLTGLARAIKNDLSGGSVQGGSTITEQFVKRYYDISGGTVPIRTKIKEIFVAIKLAKMEPKLWILTHYLNAIPLGAGANGVQAAAQTYFHRSAWQLTIAQAAMIAAMIQSPYGYDPLNPTAVPSSLGNSLLERWIYVLTNMLRDGAITQVQFNALVPDPSHSAADLKNFPKIKLNSLQADWPGYRGYIMQLVANELAAYFNINTTMAQLGNMGLQIHTTISERLMNELYNVVAAERRAMAAEGVSLPSYVHISSVLEKPGTGKILAFYGGPGYGIKHCKRYHCNVDTILQPEPVGSSFKPYVLATAVSQGMDVRSSIMNSHSPLCIPPDWTPTDRIQLSKQTANCHIFGYQPFNENAENTSNNDSVPIATATSNDPAFEDLIHRTGVENVIQMAGSLGVSSADVQGLNNLFGPKGAFAGSVQAALGEGSLTTVDQATAFSTLVAGGRRVTPHIINYIYRNGVRETNTLASYQAVPKAVAADTDYALSFDTNPSVGGATGVPNAVWDGRPMIGKTGTLGQGNNASEAWFIGAIPQYSMSVALFTNRPGGKNPEILDGLPPRPGWAGSYGGAWPATIWRAFMAGAFSNLPARPLPTPDYLGANPTFVKWVQAPPPKKKHKRCQPGQGHHHRFFFGQGNGPCQPGGPNPKGTPTPNPKGSPNPTGSPSPHPTSSSPNPSKSPSPNPSGSPSKSPAIAPFQVPHRPQVPTPASGVASLTVLATLPGQVLRKQAMMVTSGLT